MKNCELYISKSKIKEKDIQRKTKTESVSETGFFESSSRFFFSKHTFFDEYLVSSSSIFFPFLFWHASVVGWGKFALFSRLLAIVIKFKFKTSLPTWLIISAKVSFVEAHSLPLFRRSSYASL